MKDLPFLQQVVDHIEQHLSEKIDVVALANSHAVSPWHFQRLFKSHVGDTLGGYIRGRRLTRAAQLLLEHKFGIIDVAFEAGFQSHEAFTRSFKSYFHCTPQAFRETRPAVRLQDKPRLSSSLWAHMREDLQQAPHIFKRPALDLVGLSLPIPSPFVAGETHCDTMFPLWMDLLERLEDIPTRVHDTFLGMNMSPSGTFTEDTLTFFAGMPVNGFTGEVPTGMVHQTLPEQWVASFEVAVVDEDTVLKTMDYIYGYWLPNSDYTRGNGHDYEYFVDVDHFRAPQLRSQYILPLQAKHLSL